MSSTVHAAVSGPSREVGFSEERCYRAKDAKEGSSPGPSILVPSWPPPC